MHKISIIIPVWNEAAIIGQQLNYLRTHSSRANIEEIVVVDGGSTDGSREIISRFKDVRLITSPKSRAKQLNWGAREAKGSILYFLHADTFPPKDFDQKIIAEVGKNNAGCFRLKFANPDHFLLSIASWFTRFRCLVFRGGDQSLFITKRDFEKLGGFNERYIIYEDIEFIGRIFENYNFKVLPDYVITSERKFKKNGTWNLFFHFTLIHLKAWLRASPEDLYEYYKRNVRE